MFLALHPSAFHVERAILDGGIIALLFVDKLSTGNMRHQSHLFLRWSIIHYTFFSLDGKSKHQKTATSETNTPVKKKKSHPKTNGWMVKFLFP